MNFSYESILPIAPLKIAALEGCRELAETMDKYLVEFRQKSNQEFQDQPNFHGYHEDTYLIKTACPRFGTGEAKGIIYESIRGADRRSGKSHVTGRPLSGSETHHLRCQRKGTPDQCDHAIPVRKPSTQKKSARISGLCICPSGADRYGCF